MQRGGQNLIVTCFGALAILIESKTVEVHYSAASGSNAAAALMLGGGINGVRPSLSLSVSPASPIQPILTTPANPLGHPPPLHLSLDTRSASPAPQGAGAGAGAPPYFQTISVNNTAGGAPTVSVSSSGGGGREYGSRPSSAHSISVASPYHSTGAGEGGMQASTPSHGSPSHPPPLLSQSSTDRFNRRPALPARQLEVPIGDDTITQVWTEADGSRTPVRSPRFQAAVPLSRGSSPGIPSIRLPSLGTPGGSGSATHLSVGTNSGPPTQRHIQVTPPSPPRSPGPDQEAVSKRKKMIYFSKARALRCFLASLLSRDCKPHLSPSLALSVCVS
jgi:hypothetical protein